MDLDNCHVLFCNFVPATCYGLTDTQARQRQVYNENLPVETQKPAH
jgi:hypothetical protein